MKRKGKYNAVNKQEDEDGYYIDPAKANFDENSKSKENINSPGKVENTETHPMNKEIRRILLAHPLMCN